MNSSYDAVRMSVVSSGTNTRVEVNQRALIDKILARYASAGAVYRELLQNSNDAEATAAQVFLSTKDTPSGKVVTQVVYRNDGLPFRPQDWSRLRKIAEGNPDVSKVGAFGVGAYTMFSICEEPLVISGGQALAFFWKGDALWTKTAPSRAPRDKWTTFVLPSRDPYPVPDLVEFGQFLCTSLTFAQCLQKITLHVDDEERLNISKRQVQAPTIMIPPKSSSWWTNDGAVTHSPRKIFRLGTTDGSIRESVYEIKVSVDETSASLLARYVSALAQVTVSSDMAHKIHRVTKKQPPSEVNIQVYVDAKARIAENEPPSSARAIVDQFSPSMGTGSVFIGFKTSQTTGLAAHLAAPLVPTVEREAIDLQDPTLNVYNRELLSMAGILMRLTLEHSMGHIGRQWHERRKERELFEDSEARDEAVDKQMDRKTDTDRTKKQPESHVPEKSEGMGALHNFAKFMSRGAKKIADVISTMDIRGHEDESLLNPKDRRPLSQEERDAIMLMRSFSPDRSTPDAHVGAIIADGFARCMPNVDPPVLTASGVVNGSESRLPNLGIERFVKRNVVRRIVCQNAENYLKHVAGCMRLSISDLERSLKEEAIDQDDLITLLKWWPKFCLQDERSIARGVNVKSSISFTPKRLQNGFSPGMRKETVRLSTIHYYAVEKSSFGNLPMPPFVLPSSIQRAVTEKALNHKSLHSWFRPLPFQVWASFICTQPCMTLGNHEDSDTRLSALAALSKEHSTGISQDRATYETWLRDNLSSLKCIPFHSEAVATTETDVPGNLYLSTAELSVFEGLGSFRKVSPALREAGVTEAFLVAIGVRNAISIDFLFTQLDKLKWNGDPKPLLAYLRSVSLTDEDMQKLRNTQYLPAAGDAARAYAPSELHLPSADLTPFHFVRVLHWPHSNEFLERSADGVFLKNLGCRVDPDLQDVLRYLSDEGIERAERLKMLKFVGDRLRPGGSYQIEYARYATGGANGKDVSFMKFIPALRKDPFVPGSPRGELQAPQNCYMDSDVLCMGFAIVDMSPDMKSSAFSGEQFHCQSKPHPNRLIRQLLNLVSFAKSRLSGDKNNELVDFVLSSFTVIFDYLSTRTKELDKGTMHMLRDACFIPCRSKNGIRWLQSSNVFFTNSNSDTAELTSTLYHTVDFNAFLAAVGVLAEPSLHDLFHLVLEKPIFVLSKVGGEAGYRSLLRRIAVNPPFSKVTTTMRNSPFLLAYRSVDQPKNSQSSTKNESRVEERSFCLAKASDICIIDNSFFARMFNTLSAPPESDLERFYESMGSRYISEGVTRRFEVGATQADSNELSSQLMERIQQRKPLLISSSTESGRLRQNAVQLLEPEKLTIRQVAHVKAMYSLNNVTRTQDVTCCASVDQRSRTVISITSNLDWFDVGGAIGHMILKRCHLENSFLLGSLLQAPLSQLKARGFPVDRIVQDSVPVHDATSSSTSERDRQPAHEQDYSKNARKNTRVQTVSRPAESGANLNERDGFAKILKDMFPDCDKDHILSLLGAAPDLDRLREVANRLGDGIYPKENEKDGDGIREEALPSDSTKSPMPIHSQTPSRKSERDISAPEGSEGSLPKSGSRSNPLRRAIRSIRNLPSGGPSYVGPTKTPTMNGDEHSHSTDDAAVGRSLERTLRNSIKSSRKVSSAGISTSSTILTSLPEGIKREGDGCEIIPAKDLIPFTGKNGSVRTRNGVKVFVSRRDKERHGLLEANFEIAEAFAEVLASLCRVYELRLDSVAIFHENTGGTIAFNTRNSLHFNVRFFSALHYKGGKVRGSECYSYWFTVMAHELAHNLVAHHNMEHGYYTESYIILFLPKLVQLLR